MRQVRDLIISDIWLRSNQHWRWRWTRWWLAYWQVTGWCMWRCVQVRWAGADWRWHQVRWADHEILKFEVDCFTADSLEETENGEPKAWLVGRGQTWNTSQKIKKQWSLHAVSRLWGSSSSLMCKALLHLQTSKDYHHTSCLLSCIIIVTLRENFSLVVVLLAVALLEKHLGWHAKYCVCNSQKRKDLEHKKDVGLKFECVLIPLYDRRLFYSIGHLFHLLLNVAETHETLDQTYSRPQSAARCTRTRCFTTRLQTTLLQTPKMISGRQQSKKRQCNKSMYTKWTVVWSAEIQHLNQAGVMLE